MLYALLNENGVVEFLMKSGDDLVKSRLDFSIAKEICRTGKITDVTINPDYPIAVDNTYYFKGTILETPKKSNKRGTKK